MLLSREEAEMVYKLHCAVMEFANEQICGTGAPGSVPVYSEFSLEKRREVVKAFLGRPELIDAFIGANRDRFSPDELEVVYAWRHLVAGRFIALRQLKNHMILLACDLSQTVYGVMGLSQPIEQVIPKRLSAMIETVLLPFRGKIVYDGLISTVNVTFGPGARRNFDDQYRTAKANHAVVTSLAEGAVENPVRSEAPELRPAKGSQQSVPGVHQIRKQLIEMIDGFCQTSLNEEYAALCRKLAEKLAAKRPSPLLQGKLETWACGIIRTIGWVNFLADRSQSPHLKLPAIDRAFGVAESTGQGKAKAIRQMFKIHHFDHRWTLPSRWESNPLIWTLQDANGFMIDIRQQPVRRQLEFTAIP